MPLQFTLKNADGSISMTAGRKNTLTLAMTNGGQGGVEFTVGEPVSQDRAANGPSAIYLNFGQVLDEAAMAALAITPAPGWKKAFFTSPSPAWVLTPTRNNALMPRDSLGFTIDNIRPARSGKGTVILDRYKIDGSGSVSVDVTVAEPRTPKDLRIGFEQTDPAEHVLISRDGPRIANAISVVITNPSWDRPLVALDAPKDAQPRFTLRLVTGSGHGALTTPQLAKDIQVKIADEYAETWKIEKNDRADPPFWTLTPLSQEVLGTGAAASLRLALTNVVTELDPGLTPVYLAWTGVPDYLDGSTSLLVRKSPRVSIAAFTLDRSVVGINYWQPVDVTFAWTAKHATQVRLNGRTVQRAAAPSILSSSATVRVREPGEFTLAVTGEGRGNETESAARTVIRIEEFVTLATFESGPIQRKVQVSGWSSFETFDVTVTEALSFTRDSASYDVKIKGWFRWYVKSNPRQEPVEDAWGEKGAWRVHDGAILFNTGHGEVRFEFVPEGETGALKLVSENYLVVHPHGGAALPPAMLRRR